MEEKTTTIQLEKTTKDLEEGSVTRNPRRHPRKKRKGKVLLLLFPLLLLAALYALYYVNEFSVSIVLTGEEELLLDYGDAYQDPGAKAVLRGKWFLKSGFPLEDIPVQVTSDLQEDKLGRYTIVYHAEGYGWKASAQRSVRVVDRTAPIITLKQTGEAVLPGQVYREEGYIAIDNYDGILTGQVKRMEGLDTVTYTVMDSSGNPASVVRQIPYYDPVPPKIELKGEQYIAINCGTFYEEPGYSASDNADGDLSGEVAIEGEVIWYEPGTYEVVYTVADAFGNVDQVVRTVDVLALPRPEIETPRQKTIYLTFDDGPGPYTTVLLDVLDHYGVKATFFVTGSGNNGELWRMHRAGHSIGIHTLTHDYDTIYASEEAFFEDLYGVQSIIYRETGEKTTLMRFPGGGSNLASNFNQGIMSRLTEAVQNAGFQYFDWNVDSNDAGGALKAQTVADNVIEGIQNQKVSIVLQHDIHDFSVEAVEDIIVWGLDHGYQFLPLTPNSPNMHHEVLN